MMQQMMQVGVPHSILVVWNWDRVMVWNQDHVNVSACSDECRGSSRTVGSEP